MTDHQIVLRSRHDAQIVGYYERHDEQTRWTTDPKRALRFNEKSHADTIAEGLRQEGSRNASRTWICVEIA